MNIAANITISRDSSDTIRLVVEDEASHVRFLQMEFTPHDFMMALSGLSHVDASSAKVDRLEVVGKKKVIEDRRVKFPRDSFTSKDVMKEWLVQNCQEEGWILNPYLGSQSSVSHVNGEVFLNYSVYKFVKVEDTK